MQLQFRVSSRYLPEQTLHPEIIRTAKMANISELSQIVFMFFIEKTKCQTGI